MDIIEKGEGKERQEKLETVQKGRKKNECPKEK